MGLNQQNRLGHLNRKLHMQTAKVDRTNKIQHGPDQKKADQPGWRWTLYRDIPDSRAMFRLSRKIHMGCYTHRCFSFYRRTVESVVYTARVSWWTRWTWVLHVARQLASNPLLRLSKLCGAELVEPLGRLAMEPGVLTSKHGGFSHQNI